MKKIISTVCILVFSLFMTGCTPSGPTELDEITLAQLFQEKYPNLDFEGTNLMIMKRTDMHAQGALFGGGGAGMWFAANTDDGWVLAWAGNGSVSCADIEPYDFPTDMIAQCWDYENEVSVTR